MGIVMMMVIIMVVIVRMIVMVGRHVRLVQVLGWSHGS
jgi:hypothetical protein